MVAPTLTSSRLILALQKKTKESGTQGRLTWDSVFLGRQFPITPPTFFYDWLYINTLLKNEELLPQVVKRDSFTDIEFNPEKSINCQAYSVALLVSMLFRGIKTLISSKIQTGSWILIEKNTRIGGRTGGLMSRCTLT